VSGRGTEKISEGHSKYGSKHECLSVILVLYDNDKLVPIHTLVENKIESNYPNILSLVDY